MRKSLFVAAMAALALLSGCGRPAQRLVVYTAAEADQIPAYEASFKKAHPEIDVVWVRDSTGIVTAKLLAENKDEQADVVFALAASSMMQLDAAGLLAPYKPAGVERFDARFRDGRAVPHWTGEALWSAAVCINTVEAKTHNLPTPQSWEDLTRPVYRGMISMPNPASSGTGLLAVAAWLQMMGEDKGWAYMDRLHQNIASYAHSGSKPCKDAARGEVPIGISIDFRAAQAKQEGLPIDIVIPREGLGWDLEATGLVAGSHQPQLAKAFIDWAMSPEAMRLYADNFALVGDPAVSTTASKLPANLRDRLAPVSLAWTSKNRQRIIDEWSRRYTVKTEADQ